MTLRVELNEASDSYELGDDVDGVFYPFASVPGEQVRAHVANAKTNAEALKASEAAAKSKSG